MLNSQQKAFAKVLDLVEDSGCMPHVMLIGSWAEFAYREAGLLNDFAPNIKTMDVDFLVRNLRKPTPAAGLAATAKERGFYVESDRIDGTTKIIDVTGLEVEFLIGKKGAGLESSLKTNLGVTAQALRHLDILSQHPTVARCLDHEVVVPMPEAYALHKMVINSQRGVKAHKDVQAIINLQSYLDAKTIKVLYEQLTKKEKAQVRAFIERERVNFDTVLF